MFSPMGTESTEDDLALLRRLYEKAGGDPSDIEIKHWSQMADGFFCIVTRLSDGESTTILRRYLDDVNEPKLLKILGELHRRAPAQ